MRTRDGGRPLHQEPPCRLCGANAPLLASHIIPKFVYRYMRESSPGLIRTSAAPNLPVQDGPKIPLLCGQCEERLNAWETPFAERIFLPFHKGESGHAPIFQYEDWALKFAASISWRSVQFLRHQAGRAGKELMSTPETRERLATAELAWARFLLNEAASPKPFDQHVYPLDTIASGGSPNLSPMINRYLLRATDIDLVEGPGAVFVFTKMLRFMVIGFVAVERPAEWSGARLRLRRGSLGDRAFRLPGQMQHFLSGKADQVAALHGELSGLQKERTARLIDSNLDRMATSEAFRAMRSDVRMFGKTAFAVTTPPVTRGRKR